LDPTGPETHHGPFEDLDSFAGAFDDAGRNSDGVARAELRKVCPDLFLGDLFEHAHDRSLLFVKRRVSARFLVTASSQAAMKTRENGRLRGRRRRIA
jgi:hypothetical protein